MRLKASTLFGICILVAMLVVMGVSLSFKRPEMKLLPIMVAGVVSVLSVVVLLQEALVKSQAPTGRHEPAPKSFEAGEPRRLGQALAWIVGLFLGVYLLGFMVALPVFIASYMKVGGRSWYVSVGYAVILTLALFGIFEFALNSELYRGLIFLLLGWA